MKKAFSVLTLLVLVLGLACPCAGAEARLPEFTAFGQLSGRTVSMLTGAPFEPESQMEKLLFASDELTGLIGAAALMRPSKSCSDMELKSLKKKYKDKKFAAGCSREVIQQGADMLGWELDELLQKTLDAMKSLEG